MKTIREMVQEQKHEVSHYRDIVNTEVIPKLKSRSTVVGCLLTGSVARGDARKGPMGLDIDILVVTNDRASLNLEKVFGPDVDAIRPYHCISLGEVGLQIDLQTMRELNQIRTKSEAEIFAKQESEIIFDPEGLLAQWKDTYFSISDDQRKERSLKHLFRFRYLTSQYRFEKWAYRKAWIQLAQNASEAIECYLNFLYCINRWFIPRRDWLAYYASELEIHSSNHEEVLASIFTGSLKESDLSEKYLQLQELGNWMELLCKREKWIP